MAATFKIKQNDTSPGLLYEFTTPGFSLAGANVYFNMKNMATGILTINRREVFPVKFVRDAEGGPTALVEWLPGDTAVVGEYEYEFETLLSDGTIETTPNDSNEKLVIFDDLG